MYQFYLWLSGSLHLIDGRFETIHVEVNVMLLEVEGGSEAHSFDATAILVHAVGLECGDQRGTHLWSLTIICQVGSLTAQVLDEFGMFTSQGTKFVGEVVACLVDKCLKVVVSDDLVLLGSNKGSKRVSKESVHVSEGCRHSGVLIMVEAARYHFLCHGHEVGALAQIPQLMGPEGTRLADTSLHLVNDEVDVKLLGDILESLGELSRDLVVATL